MIYIFQFVIFSPKENEQSTACPFDHLDFQAERSMSLDNREKKLAYMKSKKISYQMRIADVTKGKVSLFELLFELQKLLIHVI